MSLTQIENYANLVNIKTKEDQLMFVNPNDQYISRNLMYAGVWEPHMVNVFKKYIKEDMKVMDIGANIGSHTLVLSKLVGSRGKVYAFEPCKINHDILFMNCFINKCSNVDIYKLGCGDKKKKMFIESRWNETKKEDNYGCIVLQSDQNNKSDEQIEIVPVDTLDLQVDFIKIDAETMEDKVLTGLKNTIEKCRPYMIVEIHRDELDRVVPILEKYNYILEQIDSIDFLAIPKDKQLK